MTAKRAAPREPTLVWAVGWTVGIFAVAAAAWTARFYSAAEPTAAPVVVLDAPSPPAAPTKLSAIELQAWRERAWDKIGPRLDEADRVAESSVNEKLSEVDEFFQARRAGVPAFAKEVLSLSGKWKFVKSKLPTAEDDAHFQYLNERFAQHVFSPDDLRRTLEAVVGEYASRVEGLESQLLVDVRADLSDGDLAVPGAPKLPPTDVGLKQEFQRLLTSVAGDVSRDVSVGVSMTTASLVGGEVAAQIAVRVGTAVAARLGVSAGILGAGAASSWATFGVGLVAAVVVDAALEKAVRAAGYDPEQRVAERVNGVLDQVRSMLVDGDPAAVSTYATLLRLARDDPDAVVREECRKAVDSIERSGNLGLRRELLEMNKARAALRRAALKRLVFEGEVG